MDGCAPPPQFPFPIDLSKYRKVSIDPYAGEPLTVEQIADLQFNVQLCRDSIVFFTACAGTVLAPPALVATQVARTTRARRCAFSTLTFARDPTSSSRSSLMKPDIAQPRNIFSTS